MKNKIDFFKKEIVQESNDYYSDAEQKNIRKTPIKLIKGKVKIYKESIGSRPINFENLKEELELSIVYKRMSLFLKLTFLFISICALILILKKVS